MMGYRTRKKSRAWRITGRILTVITIAMLVIITIGVYAQKIKMEKLRERCTGSVSGICVEVTSKNKTRTVRKHRRHGSHGYASQENYMEYTSRIKYTIDGRDYETLNVHENNPYPKEGGSITVYYDPSDPSVCYLP